MEPRRERKKKKPNGKHTVSRITIKHLIVRLVHFNFFRNNILSLFYLHIRREYWMLEMQGLQRLGDSCHTKETFANVFSCAKLFKNHSDLKQACYHKRLSGVIVSLVCTTQAIRMQSTQFKYIIINYSVIKGNNKWSLKSQAK